MQRQDTFIVQLVNETTGEDLGEWTGLSGGEQTGDGTKYPEGDIDVALGSRATVENVTLKKLNQLGLERRLRAMHNHEMIATKLPADGARRVLGPPEAVYRGKLEEVTPAEADKTSGDAAEIEITISTHGTVG